MQVLFLGITSALLTDKSDEKYPYHIMLTEENNTFNLKKFYFRRLVKILKHFNYADRLINLNNNKR